VEKGTIVEFTEGVYSESVKIFGTLRGDVICAGLVEVMKSGILDGDVHAQVVDLQEGGTLTGEMMIDPELKVKLPAVKGYDPSIID
jgi:cytoskeletal protein CcmA (bactofilin family)